MDLMQQLNGLEQNALDVLREAGRTGEGVQLPFPVANIWWHNGDARQKAAAKDCPPLYFGGWATDAGKLAELVDSEAVPSTLNKWTAFEGAGDKGAWQGLAARTLTVATLASRKRWIGQDGKAGPDYDAAAGLTRQHLQTLALAYIDSKPWGYVVLTTKGFQVKFLTDALVAWEKAIGPHRKELNASQIPLSAFAITLGTAGTEPRFETVGRVTTNKITPVTAIIPDNLTAEMVGKRFIGPNNLRANAERVEQAREWLAAWKRGAETPRQSDDAGAPEETEIPF
jgi:hypothetical protein